MHCSLVCSCSRSISYCVYVVRFRSTSLNAQICMRRHICNWTVHTCMRSGRIQVCIHTYCLAPTDHSHMHPPHILYSHQSTVSSPPPSSQYSRSAVHPGNSPARSCGSPVAYWQLTADYVEYDRHAYLLLDAMHPPTLHMHVFT